MRVLVTGGAGFTGSHLVDALLEGGHTVVALEDLSTGSRHNVDHLLGHRSFQLQVGPVLDRARCHQAIAEADVVVHLAAAVGVKLVAAG